MFLVADLIMVIKHELTDDNYYSKEMGLKYLSVHALMTYMKDPVIFWLKAHDYLKDSSSPSANAGRLFHAFMNDEKDFLKELKALGTIPFTIKKQHLDEAGIDKKLKDITTEDVIEMVYDDPHLLEPKADYESVWQYIANHWRKRHEQWTTPPNSYKELILTGNIGGAKFKGRLDMLTIDGEDAYIYDYKTLSLKDNYGFWYEDGERFSKNFIHEYNYDLQMMAYSQLVKQNFPQVKNVFIQFGCLIKSNKVEFSKYPSGYVETECVNILNLANNNRFNGRSPLMVLLDNSKNAYDTLQLNSDEMVKRYGSESVFLELFLNKGTQLPFDAFRKV